MLFFEQMLDLAIELASRGYNEILIAKALIGLDCPELVAKSVAAIASERFNKGHAQGTQNNQAKETYSFREPFQRKESTRSPSEDTPTTHDDPNEREWERLEPFFRAALVGPDFDANAVEPTLSLKLIRLLVYSVLIVLVIQPFTLSDMEAGEKLSFALLAAMVGWGVGFSLLELSPAAFLFPQEAAQMNVAVKANRLPPEKLYEIAKTTFKNEGASAEDIQEALVQLKIAANKGYSKAQVQLGALYVFGKSVPQNIPYAVYWLEKAAAQNDQNAFVYLGKLAYDGAPSFPKNDAKAVEYWRAGANLGSASAFVSLGWSYMMGIGQPIDYSKAASWNEKGAAGGDPEGSNNLGWLYEHGKGVPQDYQKALALYKMAADQGIREASERYNQLKTALDQSGQNNAHSNERQRVDAVVRELEKLFPPFNEKSPAFSQALTDQVLERQKQLIAQGYSPSNALRTAGFEVARRAGFI